MRCGEAVSGCKAAIWRFETMSLKYIPQSDEANEYALYQASECIQIARSTLNAITYAANPYNKPPGNLKAKSLMRPELHPMHMVGISRAQAQSTYMIANSLLSARTALVALTNVDRYRLREIRVKVLRLLLRERISCDDYHSISDKSSPPQPGHHVNIECDSPSNACSTFTASFALVSK